MRTSIAIAIASLALAGQLLAASPAGAAIANDAPSAAAAVPVSGLTAQVDLTQATSDPADPRPSCQGGQQAFNTIWLRAQLPASSRSAVVQLTARSAARGTVVALYIGTPLLGAELICGAGAAGAAAGAGFEHLLKPGQSYLMMVGTTTDGGGPVDLSVSVRASDWQVATPLAARRQAAAVAAVADALYSFGGYQTSYIPGVQSGFHSEAVNKYDPRTRAWSVIARLPIGLSYARAAVVGDRAFLPGGRANPVQGAGCIDKTHLSFNARTRGWRTLRSPDGPAFYDYAAAGDPGARAYYMVGGAWDPTPCDFGNPTPDIQASNQVQRYDVGTDRWTTIASMTNARQGAAAAVVDGWLYVIGGLRGAAALSSVEVYDPRSRVWYRGTDIPVPVYGAAAGIGTSPRGNPTIVVAGGWTHLAGGTATGLTQTYDVGANTWSTSAAAMTPRDALGGAVLHGRLYAVAGFQRQPIRTVESLKVDHRGPQLQVVVRARGAALQLDAKATDPAGIALATWRFADGKVMRGLRVRRRFTRPGRQRVTVQVLDKAGNVTTRRVRIMAPAS